MKLKKTLNKPCYFVGFRHNGKTPKRILEKLKADRIYLFSAPSPDIPITREGKNVRTQAYPWEKKPLYYSGKLERLIKDIRKYA